MSTPSTSNENQRASEKIKRPLNAFILWSKKRRRVIANENPQMHNFDISRKLGLEWQKLSEEEKALYFEEAKKLKEEHRQQYPDYKYQPRKRDKVNKRGKLLHAPPFHLNFLAAPEGTRYLRDGRVSLPSDTRSACAPEVMFPQREMTTGCEEYASFPHLHMHSPDRGKSTMLSGCPASLRQPCEGFVPYRGVESSFAAVTLRPGLDMAPYNRFSWYTAGSGRYAGQSVACYGHVLPSYISRTDLHS